MIFIFGCPIDHNGYWSDRSQRFHIDGVHHWPFLIKTPNFTTRIALSSPFGSGPIGSGHHHLQKLIRIQDHKEGSDLWRILKILFKKRCVPLSYVVLLYIEVHVSYETL